MIEKQETNRALIVEQTGSDAQYKIFEVAIPVLEDNEVLVRLSCTGVCHSDLAFIRGKYENLGLGLEGSRAMKELDASYLNDHWCTSQVAFGKDVGGSFQQYVTAPGDYLVRIPERIPDQAAAPLLCAGVTMYRALKVSKAKTGDWVVINGAGGGLGHIGVKFAKVMGFRILAIDIGSKAEFCRQLGAEYFVDVLNTSDPVDTVKRLTADKVAAVIATASNSQAYHDAARMLGNGGVAQAPRADVIEMLDFAAQHGVMPEVEVHTFDEVEKVLQDLRA
ncbi:hypothetical protein H2200_001489 [Cladophialophora chaetospira]|uniref:Enoyl reductase (ER) domain-containing protein n=1 Tax=Cladophialophora chaetospira TaxID=386627 RepID=A0AA39CP45_9EURO|nr:hypothetical protein H2200_001489 [Cladophialophora chaetospira]